MRVEDPPRFGQTQRPRAAFEQRQAHVFFDLLNLSAQRRLRHVQPLRGTREILLFGDRHEVSKLAQFHLYP